MIELDDGDEIKRTLTKFLHLIGKYLSLQNLH